MSLLALALYLFSSDGEIAEIIQRIEMTAARDKDRLVLFGKNGRLHVGAFGSAWAMACSSGLVPSCASQRPGPGTLSGILASQKSITPLR